MSVCWGDRIKQLMATGPGTGAVVPTSTPTGFAAFSTAKVLGSGAAVSNGDLIPYTVVDGAALWETGFFSYNSTGPTFTRSAGNVKNGSSGAGTLVNFNTGGVTIWCDAPAASLPLLDGSGNMNLGAGTITTTGGVSFGAAALGAITAPSLNINGTTLGTNKLAVVGTSLFSGVVTGASGFNDGGGAAGFTTTGFGFTATMGPTQISVSYSGYAIVVTSDERYKNFLEDDTAKRRAALVALHVGPFTVYDDLEKTKGAQPGFGISAQQAYSLFGPGMLGVRKPTEDDPKAKWHAEASPTGLQALWAARQALVEIDELRAVIADLKAQLDAKG